MVKKHQMAQFVLYLTSFVAIVNTRSTYFDTFVPSLVRKHQIAQFLHQLCSVYLNEVHILIYLTPVMVQKASNSTIVAVLTSFVATVHKKYIF